MVYKIGNISDLANIPITDDETFELLYHYARVLTAEYGQERNINEDDGGYILYVTSGTNSKDIKDYFDYTKHTVESVDRYGQLYSAMYILTNEFVVTIVGSIADAPPQFINEIN